MRLLILGTLVAMLAAPAFAGGHPGGDLINRPVACAPDPTLAALRGGPCGAPFEPAPSARPAMPRR